MSNYVVLSEADRKVIQNLLDRLKSQSAARIPPQPEQEDLVAPDVYLVKVPAGDGIAGLEDYVPSFADCDIWQKITEDDDDENPAVDGPLGKTIQVWNSSESVVPGDSFVLAIKDKFGTWWALGAGTTSGSTLCRAVLDQCYNVVEYWRLTDGVVTVSNIPCDHCVEVTTECTICLDTADTTFCVSFDGISNHSPAVTGIDCDDCTVFEDTITLTGGSIPSNPGFFAGTTSACPGASYGPFKIYFFGACWTDNDGDHYHWIVQVVANNNIVIMQYDLLSATTWNCDLPLTLTRNDDLFPSGPVDFYGYCNWPSTITIEPCDCASYPTVTLDTSDLIGSSASITIAGTGFSTTAAENTVIFDNGAAGIVTAATTTSLVVDFTDQPDALAALKATVIVNGCSSGALVQVATVINPLVIDCTDASLWCDSLTDDDGTHLDDHAPEIGGTYTVTEGVPGIFGNRLVDLAGGTGIAFSLDTTATAYRCRFKYLAPPTSQDSGYRTLQACFRYTDSSNNFLLFMQFPPTSNSIADFGLYKIVSSVLTLLGTGTVTLTTDTAHLIEIAVTSSTVTATIHGVTVSVTDTDLNTATEIVLAVASGNSTVFKPWIDDIKVNAIGLLTHTFDAYLAAATYYWRDTFTDSNGTALTSHTGETTPGGYTALNGTYEIQSNKCAVNALSGGNVAASLDAGQTSYTATVVFTVPTISTDSGDRTIEFHFRRIDGSNYNIVSLHWASGTDTSDASFMVRNVFFPASGGVIGSGTASLAAGVSHTLVLVVTSTTIVATIDGNSTGTITDSVNNTGTGFALNFFLTTTTSSVPVWDTLVIQP